MTEARTHKSAQPRQRAIRLNKTDTAAAAIGPLTSGMEVYCLTFGQFSLIDVLGHLARQAGPCEMVVSTWTAATADADRAKALLDADTITRFRLIVDRSFVARQRAYCDRVTALFGSDAIRTTRTHAKFAVVTNDEWALTVRTSMNLNHNPRLESVEVSDDPALAEFMLGIADSIYAETPSGATTSMDLPVLAGVRTDDVAPTVRMGQATAVRL